MNSLIMPKSLWERARAHLLQDGGEHFAFLLAGVSNSPGGISFLVRDIISIQDEDLDFSYTSYSMLKLEALLRVTNAARSKGLAVVEAHSHPFSKGDVGFSSLDMEGLEEFSAYMLNDLPGRPYGATVWGTGTVAGLCWEQGERRPLPIGEIRIVGQNLHDMATASTKELTQPRGQDTSAGFDRFERQIRALGKEGQEKIRKVKVAIVGVGGIGSYVVMQLAHLGVREFTLVDFDVVEETNLNRLVGATEADIGRHKVRAMERMIYSIVGKKGADVEAFEADVRNSQALDALKQVDIIFGCLDNDGARLVLNELALAYYIPLIDCGVGIKVENDEIIEAGGRVMVVHPDGPCLLCAREISTTEASNDLAPPEELEVRRRQGYVNGAEVPSPSVISLNGVIASIAVTEFLALVTGFRPTKEYTVYDMLEGKVVQRIAKSDPRCYACSLKGVGDRAEIKRYSFSGVPVDIPGSRTDKPSIKERALSQKPKGIPNSGALASKDRRALGGSGKWPERMQW